MIVDIHSHILPGLDDGAMSWQESIMMAKQAVHTGITHVIATPHHKNGTFVNDPTEIINRTAEINIVLNDLDIPLEVLPGMEYHLSSDVSWDIKDLKKNITPLSEGNKYILIELPCTHIPHFTEFIICQLQLMGYIPVIAHPERNAEIKKKPNRLFDFINLGALAQVTAASILGVFGEKSQRFTLDLLKHRLVHFIASDAHNTVGRSFDLVPAYSYVEKHVSKDYMEYMTDNAIHVINGTHFSVFTPVKFEKRKKLFFFYVR